MLCYDAMVMNNTSGKKRGSVTKAAVALIWIVLWAVAARVVNLPVLLPGPLATVRKLIVLMQESAFWSSVALSFVRIGLGYLIAVILGVLFAILCTAYAAADALFSPLRTLIRSTPISSIIILVLLWLDIEIVPLFIVSLTVLPIVWQNVQEGIKEVDPLLLEMADAYHLSGKKRMAAIWIPSVMPYFYTACATSIGFAWKAGIAAEVIAKPMHSIGRNLQDAKVYLNTDELFAWTLAVVLLSLILERLLRRSMFGGREGQGHADHQ